jgi:DNA-binding NtrC family response regulator
MPKNILFVDDDPNLQKMVEIFLRTTDYHLSFAKNGRTALKMYQEGSFDLILTDIQMPEMDGITLVREINKLDKSIPIIIISAFGKKSMAQKAIAEGASKILDKPFDSQALIGIIKELLPAYRD